MLDHVEICSQIPECGLSELHHRGMFRRTTHERITEYVGHDVLRKGFQVDSVVDPDEMQPRILGNDDLSALHSLSMQRRDIAAILLRHPPESGRYRLKVL